MTQFIDLKYMLENANGDIGQVEAVLNLRFSKIISDSERDRKDMRRFQANFMITDRALREIAEADIYENETQRLVDLAKNALSKTL